LISLRFGSNATVSGVPDGLTERRGDETERASGAGRDGELAVGVDNEEEGGNTPQLAGCEEDVLELALALALALALVVVVVLLLLGSSAAVLLVREEVKFAFLEFNLQ
jgi:hypothetical protein